MAACCKWPATSARDAEIRTLADQGVDWRDFVALVRRHRVGGMVHAALGTAEVAVPAPFGLMLTVQALQIRQQNAKSAAETVRIQRLLDAAGIPALFFKGATLGQLVYGRLDIKQSKDIDFLVPAEHAQRVTEMLAADGGYRMWLPRPQLTAAQWRQHLHLNNECAMIAPATGLQVEPHWRLSQNPHFLPHLDAHSASIAVELDGFGTSRTFTREDLFAYLCLHGAVHGWVRLKWLADVHAMVAPLSPVERNQFYRHAAAMSGPVIAGVAFALCVEVFGFELPQPVARAIAADPAVARIVALSLAGMHAPEPQLSWRRGAALQLMIAGARGCLGSQVWRLLIGGAETLDHPLPRPLHFLYIPLRLPLGLWRKLTRKSLYPPLPTADAQPLPPARSVPAST